MIEEEKFKTIEDALYWSLKQKKNDFDEFCAELADKGVTYLGEELDEAKRLFKKFNPNEKHKDRFSKIFSKLKEKIDKISFIKEEIGGAKTFAYGFYHNRDEKPLYIGCTGKLGNTRLNQHFQMYSSAFVNFPMLFLDEIKIWSSDTLNEGNIKLFEIFLIKELKPYFNKQRSNKNYKNQQIIFQKLLDKYSSILISDLDPNYKRLFNIFS